MNRLSVQAINESSSYEVSEVSQGCYQFFTDHGVHCTVEFVPDDSLMSRETYHLVIVNVNHQKSLRKLNTLPNTSAGFLQLNGILGKQGASFSWENLREDAYSDKYGI